MRRRFVILILVLSFVLSSCSGLADESNTGSTGVDASTLHSESLTNPPADEEEPLSTQDQNPPSETEEVRANLFEEPPYDTTYSFSAYDELKWILDPMNRGGLDSIGKGREEYGAAYQTVLDAFEKGDVLLLTPHLAGKELELRDEVDLSRISVFTSELYNLPWIWYHCKVNGQSLRVQIAYLDVLEHSTLRNCKTYLDALSLIAPSAPSPSNFQKFSSYHAIYEKDIVVGGRTVTALVSELENDTREYVKLYMDGVLVTLYADKQLLTDEFFAAFTLEP